MIDLGKENVAIAEGCNAAFCAIGTPFNDVFNKKKQDSYRMMDFGIAAEFAKFAKKAGVEYFSTIAGEDTDGNSQMNIYVVKRDVENLIKTLCFERIAVMRPGFLNRGKDAGWTEKLMVPSIFSTHISKVAGTMLWGAIYQTEDFKGYTTKEIKAKAKEQGV